MITGIFLGYRMAPGGRFGGEYIAAPLDDFVGRSLDKKMRHTSFKFHEHHVQKLELPPLEGRESQIESPLKRKYDLMNDDYDGRDNLVEMAALPFDDDGIPPEINPESMGTSYIGPYHRGMYARDRLVNKYPVDRWGVRVFFSRDPNKVYRPEEVTEGRWTKGHPGFAS